MITCLLWWTLVATLVTTSEQVPLSLRLASQVVNTSQPAARNWPSDTWRPVIFTECFAGLHNSSAPCRRVPNLVYAEELVYPDFRIRLPRFLNPEQKEVFLAIMHNYRNVWLRGKVIDNFAYFLNQRGQNLIYANVSYVGKPVAGRWADDSCVSYNSHHHVSSFPTWSGSPDAPAAIFVASPDDYSFQHFSDRVAMLLAQVRHIGDPSDWKYISSRGRVTPNLQELWSMLVPGFTTNQLILGLGGPVHTRLFLYPCQTPLIHPYTHQLSSELYQQAAGFDPAIIEPISSRPVVLFMERRASSRGWVNEEECKQSIEALLASRGKGEQLVPFRAQEHPTYKSVITLGRRVKMMVGVHGGALFNVIFMQPGTSVVEICPVSRDNTKSRCGAMIWELASVRRMPYHMVLANQTTATWEITHLDCSLVVAAVRGALEEADGYGAANDPLESFHQGSSFGR